MDKEQQGHLDDLETTALGALDTQFAFGPYQFSPTRQLLTLDGQPVRLGSRALAILSTLIERSGHLVSREELIAGAWPNTHVEEGNLRVHISALRKALGDSNETPRFIVNVAGRGYRFIAPVQRVEPEERPAPFEPAPSSRRDELPSLIASVYGRSDDIDALTVILKTARQISLVGTGGIGKTTVALELAHRVKHLFDDGAFFVDLAAVSDPAVVPFAIASAIHVAIDTEQPVESLASKLRANHALLILDNCEHLIDAAAQTTENLLKGSPRLHIIATSHEPLRIQGERVYRLAPFELPSGVEDLTLREALAYPAIQLFVEHMLAADDAGLIGDADVPFIVEIGRRLDGLALAIEIAASRAGAFGIAELASRLDDRLGILTAGRRTAANRHQTLRNMLDWSHDNLGDVDRIVLRRLAVFAGEFTFRAAGLVAGDEHLTPTRVLEGVSSLVRKSLLMQTSRAGAASFRMLDSARIYALEKLGLAGEVRRVRALHVHYLCDILREAESSWPVTPAQTWTSTYSRYIDDIRTALTWSFGPTGDTAGGVLLTSLALPLAMQLGLHDEFGERMVTAIERAKELPSPLVVPELRLHVAKNHLTYNVGQSLDDTFRRAIELAELTGKDRHRIEPLVTLGSTHISLGQYESSAAIGGRALAMAERSGDEFAVLSVSRAMAQAAHYSGQHERALDLAKAVLRHRVVNIPYTYGFMHTDRRITMRWVLVRSLWMTGHADSAVRVAEEGITIADEAGPVALAQLLGMAVIPMYLWRGDHRIARNLVGRLLEHSERYSFKHWKAWCTLFENALDWHDGLGPVAPAMGTLQAQTLSTVVGLAVEPPPVTSIADWAAPELLRLHGLRLVENGDLEGGEDQMARAVQISQSHGAVAWELRAVTSLARLWQDRRREDAVSRLSDVLGRMPEGHDTADVVAAQQLLGQIT
ncbi:helix-turn-helix transcriptional regulator [Devosia sp. XJ19-1]|uniref:Helix-turn-helix transcriptional regulator n=1 Tax=Devosia ureilytica TaxID=2952754 RepID=A0A9Q4ALE6_9HYPH|nr:winged helix-turn-helix domain-containing protein [Devosia ureilytica]MCP8882337.1 helix-turn-helix transcriptional regulator [Devosia ureilytica]MCP8885776.1 helix-turn-helix transcriptional regulator [Devosia ureilytica]